MRLLVLLYLYFLEDKGQWHSMNFNTGNYRTAIHLKMQSVHIHNAYTDKNLSNPSAFGFSVFLIWTLSDTNNNRMSKHISPHTALNWTLFVEIFPFACITLHLMKEYLYLIDTAIILLNLTGLLWMRNTCHLMCCTGSQTNPLSVDYEIIYWAIWTCFSLNVTWKKPDHSKQKHNWWIHSFRLQK